MSRSAPDRERFFKSARVTPSGTELGLEIAGLSDPGLVRSENQDALGYRVPDDPTTRVERGMLFVVCDGVGTLSAGQDASSLGLRCFTDAYYGVVQGQPEQMLRAAVARANAELRRARHSYAGPARLGTTLVAVLIRGREYYVLNVGDSRAYIWRNGELRQVSRDHRPAFGGGEIDRRISRALGTDPQVKADVFGPNGLEPGDNLLLCSDGLTTAVSDSTIARVIGNSTPAEAAMLLVERVKTAGARDNVSVLLVRAGTPPAGETTEKSVGVAGWGARASLFWRGIPWASLSPFHVMAQDRWRTRRGLLVLAAWLLCVLAIGLVLGWLMGR